MRSGLVGLTLVLTLVAGSATAREACRTTGDQRQVLSGSDRATAKARCRIDPPATPTAKPPEPNRFQFGNTTVTVRGSVSIDFATGGYPKGP
jgi:hypothetical protein